MFPIIERVKNLEHQLQEAKAQVERLKDLINKGHVECFPPESKTVPRQIEVGRR